MTPDQQWCQMELFCSLENYSRGTQCVKNNFRFVSIFSKCHCMVSEDLTYSTYTNVQKFGFDKRLCFWKKLISKAAFFIINIVILWNIITIWNNCFILSYIFKWDLFLWRNAIFSSSLHLLQLSVSNNLLEIILIWYSLIKSSISKPSRIFKKKIPLWIQSSKEYNLSEMVIF